MSRTEKTAIVINTVAAVGAMVGALIHPLLSAAIAGLGGYIIFRLGKIDGIQYAVTLLRHEFSTILNSLDQTESN